MDQKNVNGLNEHKICIESMCTACTACENICPRQCISMRKNVYGELHPIIDIESCINCGLCRKVCPNNKDILLLQPQKCYAGWRIDKEKCLDSSSGGIATVLAEYFVKNNNVVYGVIYQRGKGIIYTRATTVQQVDKFKGSKYVQAELGSVFKNIILDLTAGKKVLFLGTPCHVAGLKEYVKLSHKNYLKNLFLVDFLCHGSVPNSYFMEEMQHIEKKTGFQCDEISFRSNRPNRNYYLCLKQNSEVKYIQKAEKQRYFYGFLNSIISRESCLSCGFKQVNRVADLTLGDFIGLGRNQKFEPKDAIGINPSLIFTNNEKGTKLLECCSQEIRLYERSVEEAVQGGPSLRGGAKVSGLHKKFRNLYPKLGFIEAIDKAIGKQMFYSDIKNKFQNLYKRAFRVGKKIIRLVIKKKM